MTSPKENITFDTVQESKEDFIQEGLLQWVCSRKRLGSLPTTRSGGS